ncbi:carbonic anhydrase [Streptomyces thermolilacinus SPC6]|uniref:Carbonic anhydrase n=1 Tax=Streptomyces thermolilacinus SPC6 TaxID=1306406 RepID=A0A1D3DZK9_9ACTN|nr:carbonic anhydrase [Streptomyces thermolilacinus SPC6]
MSRAPASGRDATRATASEGPAPEGPTAPSGADRPDRRALLRAALAGGVVLGAGAGLPATPAVASPAGAAGRPDTPRAALRALRHGNRRWATRHQTHPHESNTDRLLAVSGQHPFAVVLGCIDSRVPPELVFDQGLGDLMTVRSAGCVLDEAVLGSIAYGVLELGIPLVMVLGHQSCGAVTAAVHAEETGEQLPAHIAYVAEQIRPAIDHRQTGQARVDATITANVRLVRSRLAAEPDLTARTATGRLAIVGARYELNTQRVELIN